MDEAKQAPEKIQYKKKGNKRKLNDRKKANNEDKDFKFVRRLEKLKISVHLKNLETFD